MHLSADASGDVRQLSLAYTTVAVDGGIASAVAPLESGHLLYELAMHHKSLEIDWQSINYYTNRS